MKRLSLLVFLMMAVLVCRAAEDLSVFGSADTNHIPRLPGPDDRNISRLVVALLEKQHFIQHPLDKDFSSKFLDRYLDSLDPQHMLFVKSDLDEFEKYRFTVGDLTKRMGDTMPGEIIFARFLDRCVQQALYVTNLLAQEKFDFTSDERYLFNRKDVPRPLDLSAAQKIWRDRVRHEYLLEKLGKKKHDEIVKIIIRRYARMVRTLGELDTDEVLQIYLSALARVYDPHSEYMGKPTYENFNINMKLALFGIGAVLKSEDGYCTIVSLSPGSPAEKSKKLKPNDKVVAVAQGSAEPVDVVDMKLTKVVEMIRGAKGSEVRLTVVPADATDSSVRKVVTLVRDEIKLEDSEAKARIFEVPTGNGKPAKRLGIIGLPSFYADLGNRAADHKSTTTDCSKLIKKLNQEKIDGLVLDLRGNGGGSLEEAIRLSGLFIKEGPIVQVKDWDGSITADRDNDTNILYNGPLLVMTSRGSASASEIFAGAMQDYGRGLIVGESSTHGKGTVQTVQELNRFLRTTNNLGALKFTIRKFYRANGSSTQLKGVTPDIELASMYNFADAGEGSIPGALSWDTINSAKYEPVNLIRQHLAELKKRTEERTAKDRDFDWIREEIERYKKIKLDKTVSLNEAERIREKKETEDRAEARKKELKARKDPDFKVYEITLKLCDVPGLPPPVTKTNTVAAVVTKEKTSKTAEDSEDGDEENKDESMPPSDPHMDEARRILLDLIELTNKSGEVAAKP